MSFSEVNREINQWRHSCLSKQYMLCISLTEIKVTAIDMKVYIANWLVTYYLQHQADRNTYLVHLELQLGRSKNTVHVNGDTLN